VKYLTLLLNYCYTNVMAFANTRARDRKRPSARLFFPTHIRVSERNVH